MKRRILMLLLAACALAAQPAFAGPRPDQQEAIESVLRLVDAGLSDGVIIRHIHTRGYVFELSDKDLIELRRRGVSDAVLEVMLDTALVESGTPRDSELVTEPEPAPDQAAAPADEGSQSHVSVVLSAGWFSPWYYYPSAWGFYYDPFPAWYSYYYYPFRFCSSWGYYGYCSNYYYANCWRPYRYWDDPWCYQTAIGHPGVRVNTPRTDVITWRTGRGLSNARPHYISTSGTRSAAPAANPVDAPTVRRRMARDAVHTRPAESGGSGVPQPRSARYDAAPVQAPRSQPARTGAPSPAPRQHVPSSHFATPSSGPHFSPPSSAPHGGSMAPAGRSGGASMAPRSGVGARMR